MKLFKVVKNHFDNSFNLQDGWECPSCKNILDPDEIIETDQGLMCPCGFIQEQDREIDDIESLSAQSILKLFIG